MNKQNKAQIANEIILFAKEKAGTEKDARKCLSNAYVSMIKEYRKSKNTASIPAV